MFPTTGSTAMTARHRRDGPPCCAAAWVVEGGDRGERRQAAGNAGGGGLGDTGHAAAGLHQQAVGVAVIAAAEL